MAAKTPIVKAVKVNGIDVDIHACPWSLYRKIYGTENTTDKTLELIEEVVRECAVPKDPSVDVVATCSKGQINRLFELAVSDNEEPKPDF